MVWLFVGGGSAAEAGGGGVGETWWSVWRIFFWIESAQGGMKFPAQYWINYSTSEGYKIKVKYI